MYCTSGYIIEKLTNQTYANFITEKILKPLGLEDTSYDAAAAIKSGKLADGFLPVPVIKNRDAEVTDDSVFKPVPYFDPLGGHSVIDPAGGIISNVKDLARWLQTLLLLGHHPDTNASIIPPALITKSAQGASIVPSLAEIPEFSPIVYGFGQMKFSFQGHVIVEHSGGTIGHISAISRAPYDHLGIAILTNTQTLLSQLIKWKLYEKALGLKQLNWDSIYQDVNYKPTSFRKNATDSETVKAQPMLSFRDLAGIYFNQAYGSITLCDFQHSINPHCSSTVSTVSSALDGPKPDLVASWDKIWSSHLLLTHRNADYFNLRVIKVFPPPFPESFRSDDHKPFAVDTVAPNASAKFSYTPMASGEGWRVDGIAVSDIWGASDGFMKRNGENKDTAEVWFDRVL